MPEKQVKVTGPAEMKATFRDKEGLTAGTGIPSLVIANEFFELFIISGS